MYRAIWRVPSWLAHLLVLSLVRFAVLRMVGWLFPWGRKKAELYYFPPFWSIAKRLCFTTIYDVMARFKYHFANILHSKFEEMKKIFLSLSLLLLTCITCFWDRNGTDVWSAWKKTPLWNGILTEKTDSLTEMTDLWVKTAQMRSAADTSYPTTPENRA